MKMIKWINIKHAKANGAGGLYICFLIIQEPDWYWIFEADTDIDKYLLVNNAKRAKSSVKLLF